ncbi:MAG: fused MFS/spermidine synthase [Candidatus Wallbacteria bacterium]|nr:fused MFS/spermidine synthase [Candidatus Wallbacteria bacterium]
MSGDDDKHRPDRMLQAAVFLCGLAVMGIEMAASRLLAPYFGTSLFTWTNLIGAIMTALSAGYWIGGRMADRHPRHEVLYRIILAAGALVAAIPYLTQPVMALSVKAIDKGEAGVVAGSLLATIVLFAVPVVLLGMVSPFAIRLASRGEERLGNTAGNLYALSTFGSIAGTFLPALVTIPLIGTRRTILTFAAILIVVGAAGLARRAVAAAPLAVLLVWLAPFGPIRDASLKNQGVCLMEDESPYHYIQVLDKDGRRLLVLNEGQAVHSIFEGRKVEWKPMVGSVWDSMNALPILLDKKPGSRLDVLIVGLAAGTMSKELIHFFGKLYDLHVDGVEIDGRIVEMGRRYFEMNEPQLDVHVMDGRIFLARSERKWDLIMGDAYRQPYIPFHLATREYFQLVRDHLAPGGLMSINVGSPSLESPVATRIVNTVSAVFPRVSVLDVINPPASHFNNYVVIAGDRELDGSLLEPSPGDLCELVVGRSNNGWLGSLMARRRADLHSAETHPTAGVLEDDRAPVEVLTDWIIFEIASGSGEKKS